MKQSLSTKILLSALQFWLQNFLRSNGNLLLISPDLWSNLWLNCHKFMNHVFELSVKIFFFFWNWNQQYKDDNKIKGKMEARFHLSYHVGNMSTWEIMNNAWICKFICHFASLQLVLLHSHCYFNCQLTRGFR